MSKLILNSANGFHLPISDKSRNQIVKELAASGNVLGKTSVSDLLAGKRDEIKGFKIIEEIPQVQKIVGKRGRKISNTVKLVCIHPENITKVLRKGAGAFKMAQLINSGVSDYATITTTMQSTDPLWGRQKTQVYGSYLEKRGIIARQGLLQYNKDGKI